VDAPGGVTALEIVPDEGELPVALIALSSSRNPSKTPAPTSNPETATAHAIRIARGCPTAVLGAGPWDGWSDATIGKTDTRDGTGVGNGAEDAEAPGAMLGARGRIGGGGIAGGNGLGVSVGAVETGPRADAPGSPFAIFRRTNFRWAGWPESELAM
jgi:hypothetical protein